MAEKGLNLVQLIGRLGRDAETGFTSNGSAVTKFSLGTTYGYKQADSWKEETEWVQCVLWRNEKIAQYLTKGSRVYVQGRLKTRKWEDKSGNTVQRTEVVVDSIILLGGKGEAVAAGEARAAAVSAPNADLISDDDVPF
jgi:single-strand DNA-binding protein